MPDMATEALICGEAWSLRWTDDRGPQRKGNGGAMVRPMPLYPERGTT